MELGKIIDLLSTKIPSEKILINEPMKNHTSFKIGGSADLFIRPSNSSELKEILQIASQHDIPFYVMGNGSNLLVDDAGFRGLMIQLYKNFSAIEVQDSVITAYSGALLSQVATAALNHELTGFEFAHGIPGTLGGAVTMNAGAYGGEIKDVIVSAEVMDIKGNIFSLSKDDLSLGYRKSIIEPNHYIVLKAVLKLEKGEKDKISSLMKELAERRRDKQPLEMPSAGSTFKRPEGHFAGKLIMDAGLRGYKVGGAMVSDKHCGFVVSDGSATFQDVKKLIEHIQYTVKQKFDVDLNPEVKIISS